MYLYLFVIYYEMDVELLDDVQPLSPPVSASFDDLVRENKVESEDASHMVELYYKNKKTYEGGVGHVYCDLRDEVKEVLLIDAIVAGYSNGNAVCVFEWINWTKRDPEHKIRFVLDVDYDPNKTPELQTLDMEQFMKYFIKTMARFVLFKPEDRFYVLKSNKPGRCESYHVATPAIWNSNSGTHLYALEMIFLDNPSARRNFAPYVDLGIYQSRSHSLRAPLCDRYNQEDRVKQGRPFELYEVWDCEANIDVDTFEELRNDLHEIYKRCCMRVRSEHSTLTKDRLQEAPEMMRFEKAAQNRISVGKGVVARSDKIDFSNDEYFDENEVTRIIASTEWNHEQKVSQLIKYMNNFFGVIRGESSGRNLVEKVAHSYYNWPSIVYKTFSTFQSTYCNVYFPMPDKRFKKRKVSKGSKQSAKRVRGENSNSQSSNSSQETPDEEEDIDEDEEEVPMKNVW